MREEYKSVLSTPTVADNISRFGRYRYIGKAQISVGRATRGTLYPGPVGTGGPGKLKIRGITFLQSSLKLPV